MRRPGSVVLLTAGFGAATLAGARTGGRAAPEAGGWAAAQQVVACFAPGTTAEQIAAFYERFEGGPWGAPGAPSQRYVTATRWAGAVGEPLALTYSFPSDNIFIGEGGFGLNVLNATLTSLFADDGGEARWKQIFRDCFDRWGEITGINFIEVPDDKGPWPQAGGSMEGISTRGDIRIVMGVIEGSTIAYNYFPPRGDMMLNVNYADLFATPYDDYRGFRALLFHELGHGLGLHHSCPANGTKVMEPFFHPEISGPELDDVRGAQSLYGDRFEPAAVNLGQHGLEVGETLTIDGVSLHNPADSDLYLFNCPAPSRLSITLAPTGHSYLAGPQSPDGSCTAGAVTNALAMHDLSLQLISPTSTILATANATGAGGSEAITGWSIVTPGVYRARVVAAVGFNEPQMYALSVRIDDATTPGDVTGDGVVNAADLGALLGAWGPCSPGPCLPDLNGDGVINATDLALLLTRWT